MIGAIIGDIVGSQFMTESHKDKDFELFTPECRFTGDTVTTCAVAEALLKKKKSESVQEATVRMLHKMGKDYPDICFGGFFERWIREEMKEPYNSLGNIGAMRVTPVAFSSDSLADALTIATDVTEVTHNHWEGIKGAMAVTEVIWMARQKATFEYIRAVVNEKYYKLDFTCDGIRETYEHDETCMGSVPQAIEAFLESDSFEDAIRTAVSLGGDNAIVCMVGAMAEAYWGVPKKLRARAQKYLDKRLLDTVKRFDAKYQGAEPVEESDAEPEPSEE